MHCSMKGIRPPHTHHYSHLIVAPPTLPRPQCALWLRVAGGAQGPDHVTGQPQTPQAPVQQRGVACSRSGRELVTTVRGWGTLPEATLGVRLEQIAGQTVPFKVKTVQFYGLGCWG